MVILLCSGRLSGVRGMGIEATELEQVEVDDSYSGGEVIE